MRTTPLLRGAIVTTGAVVAFVLLHEVTILDSRYAARQATLRETTAPPAPGARLRFSATAYCKGTTTASGARVRTGMAAADPTLLPVGSIVQIDSLGPEYNGVYTIMDTGPMVQGRHIDIYMWSCHEALSFGRRSVMITVLRLGWNPRASASSLVDTMFRRREADRAAEDARPRVLPSRPLPIGVP